MGDSQFFQSLVEKLQVIVQCKKVSLYLLDSSGTRLELKAGPDAEYDKQQATKEYSYDYGAGVTGWIAQQGKFDQKERENPNKTFVGVPLKTFEGKVLGLFKAEDKIGENPTFTDVDVAVAESVADLAALAIAIRLELEEFHRIFLALSDEKGRID